MLKTTLGELIDGDVFFFNGKQYKSGHLIKNTNSYVACTDMLTHKVTRLHIDTPVEVE